MSNTENTPGLYESRDCPVIDGHRFIEHLATANGGGISVNRIMPRRGRGTIGD